MKWRPIIIFRRIGAKAPGGVCVATNPLKLAFILRYEVSVFNAFLMQQLRASRNRLRQVLASLRNLLQVIEGREEQFLWLCLKSVGSSGPRNLSPSEIDQQYTEDHRARYINRDRVISTLSESKDDLLWNDIIVME